MPWALRALRKEIWDIEIATQFRTAKMVTRLTKYWNTLAEELDAFINASPTNAAAIATAQMGFPLRSVLAKSLGA